MIRLSKAIKMCNTAGIIPHASFILGLPGETPETIQETVDFGLEMKKLGLSYGFHPPCPPFPGLKSGTDVIITASVY